MAQHFLLIAAARTLSLRRIMSMTDDAAFALFKQCRRGDKDAICTLLRQRSQALH